MEQSELLRVVIQALDKLKIPYMITGSHASAYYGEPRFTRDIDIVADIQPGQVKDFVGFFPVTEYYCDADMILAEIRNRGQFNIIHSVSGLKIDIILTKTTPFSKSEFTRKIKNAIFSDTNAYFASPEDVIIKKMEFYVKGGSEKHLRDITAILKISGDSVDRNYISLWAERLGLTEVWEAVKNRSLEKE